MAGPKTPIKGAGSSKSSPNPASLKNVYLISYNIASCLAWAYCLFCLTTHLVNTVSVNTSASQSLLEKVLQASASSYAEFGQVVRVVQSAALLELIHVLLRLVRSSLVTTGMQVASRIVMVWYICYQYPIIASSPAYSSMVFAWSFTEVIRYSHYATGLLNLKIGFLEWARYSTFYVLYPIGAGSEATLIWLSAELAGKAYGPLGDYATKALVMVWPPALAIMMLHMHAQRSKYVVKGRGGEGGSRKKRLSTPDTTTTTMRKEMEKKLQDTPSRGTRSKSKAA